MTAQAADQDSQIAPDAESSSRPIAPFVTVLLILREMSGLSDTRFAREVLHISGGQLSQMRNGLKRAGVDTMNRAYRAYPWLHELFGLAVAGQLDTSDPDKLRELIEFYKDRAARAAPLPASPSTAADAAD